MQRNKKNSGIKLQTELWRTTLCAGVFVLFFTIEKLQRRSRFEWIKHESFQTSHSKPGHLFLLFDPDLQRCETHVIWINGRLTSVMYGWTHKKDRYLQCPIKDLSSWIYGHPHSYTNGCGFVCQTLLKGKFTKYDRSVIIYSPLCHYIHFFFSKGKTQYVNRGQMRLF